MTASHAKKFSAALSPEDRATRDRRIANRVKSGLTISDVARMFHLDVKTIRAICAEHGVEVQRGRRNAL
jgi:DNA-binding NarL/FixJ family response regulator